VGSEWSSDVWSSDLVGLRACWPALAHAKSGPRTKAEAAQNSQNAQISHAQGPASKRGSEQNPYGSTIAILEARCPDLVPVERWQQAVSGGKTFLTRWGDQAHALGWTARDLFGLIAVPEHA